jgi:thermitase
MGPHGRHEETSRGKPLSNRRLRRAVALAALVAVGVLFSVTGHAGAEAYEPTTILVKFSTPAKASAAGAWFGDDTSARIGDRVAVVRLRPGRSVDAAIAAYARLPGVEYAEPNYIARTALASPNDPSFGSQWNMTRIAAVTGWSTYPGTYATLGGARIAILDTGVDTTHPDLDGHVLAGQGASCLTGVCVSATANDQHGHGSHVAGIAAAETNNATGVAGVAYTSQLVPVQVLGANGSGSYASIAAGIDWAVASGARVINMSLSGTSPSATLCDAVSRAVASGVVVVAAAGNNSTSSAAYPAACPGAVGVSATDSGDRLASYSNYGSTNNVFVAAPGSSILSTSMQGGYATLSGTSMAAPHVAGLAALLLGQSPGRSAADVKRILASSSEKIGSVYLYGGDPFATCGGCTWSTQFGYGLINVGKALGQTAPPPSTQCSDGVDNDGDGLVDYPADPGCSSTTDNDETNAPPPPSTQCSDGVDNDGDGLVDYPADPGCSSTTDNDETNAPPPPGSILVAYPTGTSVLTGVATGGSAASLAQDDASYFSVRSGSFLSAPSWYGRFTGVPATASSIKVTYKGRNSRSCTQTVSIYRWSTATWTELSSRSVGTSDVLLADLAAPAPAGQYVSGGEVRVRVTCSVFTLSGYSTSGNLLSLSVAY